MISDFAQRRRGAKFCFLYLYIRNGSFGDLCPSPVPIAIGSSGNPFVPGFGAKDLEGQQETAPYPSTTLRRTI